MAAETVQKRVILFDSNGVEMSVENGVAIPVGTRGLLIAGSDGANSRFATVKAPSTAAVATDPSLVVSLSPNNSVATTAAADVVPATQNITTRDLVSATAVGANGQSIITGAPTAGSTALFAVSSLETVQVQVTGTWTGTLQVEISQDGGTTWYIRRIHQAGTDVISASFTANFAGGANVAGYTNIRVRAIAAMTGTATVRVVQSLNNNVIYVGNAQRITDNAGNYLPTMDAVARRGFVALTDGTNGPVAVKAASTAAVATDPALVVARSPNDRSLVAAAATLTNVASSASSVSLLAANTARRGLIVYNDSTQTLYLKFGVTASTTSFTYLMTPKSTLEMILPIYQGAIDGVWASANGSARITELT